VGEFLIEISTMVSSTVRRPVVRSRWRGLRAMSSPHLAGVDRGLHHQPMLRCQRGEDRVVLVGGEGAALLLDLLGQLGVGAGVERHDPVHQCPLEHRLQHGVVLAHRRGGEAVLGGGGDPPLHLRGEDLAHRPSTEGGDEVLVQVKPVGGQGGGLDVLGGQPDCLDVLGEGDLAAGVVVPVLTVSLDDDVAVGIRRCVCRGRLCRLILLVCAVTVTGLVGMPPEEVDDGPPAVCRG
jgi:hypothetical protein